MGTVTLSTEEYEDLIGSTGRKRSSPSKAKSPSGSKGRRQRKASAYSKRYGAAFKRLQKKYKTKSGAWRKGGFKACQKAAHKAARK